MSTYLWSQEVLQAPHGEIRNLLSCWATYANNNYIPHIDNECIGVMGNITRENQIPFR